MTKTKTSTESKPLAPLKEFEAATHHLASTDADWRELIRQAEPPIAGKKLTSRYR